MIILAAIAMKNSIDAHEKALIARAKEENINVASAVQNRFGDYMTNSSISPLVGIIIPEENETIEMQYDYIISYLRVKMFNCYKKEFVK